MGPGSGLVLPDQPRIVIGPGTAAQLGELATELGSSRALLVTDPGIVAAGHVSGAIASLEAGGLTVRVFDRVHENPGADDVEDAITAAQSLQPDLLIGFGGGSSMDTAKGCNFVLAGGGSIADYRGVGRARGRLLPLIAVPTTAGTGSECQSYALITDPSSCQKMVCGDPKALPTVAVLDPVLTMTQPQNVTANTGIDTLAHVIETAVTTRRTELSWRYTRHAFALTLKALPEVVEHGGRLKPRADMQLAAALAGAAIECSMLGAAHSAANPLTAHFGVVHGQAVGVMLPAVVRYNGQDPASQAIYAELIGGDPADAPEVLATMIDNMLALIGLPRSLGQFGVGLSDIDRLAADAAKQWTAQFNPRPVDANNFLQMYQSRLGAE